VGRSNRPSDGFGALISTRLDGLRAEQLRHLRWTWPRTCARLGTQLQADIEEPCYRDLVGVSAILVGFLKAVGITSVPSCLTVLVAPLTELHYLSRN